MCAKGESCVTSAFDSHPMTLPLCQDIISSFEDWYILSIMSKQTRFFVFSMRLGQMAHQLQCDYCIVQSGFRSQVDLNSAI